MFKVLVFAALLATVPAFAQTPPAQQVKPGCTFSWGDPMVDDPQNPDQLISAWALEGDLDGFQWVTNDVEVWDAFKMSLIDKADRTVTCSTVGVEDVGQYVIMIKTIDTSGNTSPHAALAFELVQTDTTPNTGVPGVCAEWVLGTIPMKLCSN